LDFQTEVRCMLTINQKKKKKTQDCGPHGSFFLANPTKEEALKEVDRPQIRRLAKKRKLQMVKQKNSDLFLHRPRVTSSSKLVGSHLELEPEAGGA